jgi:hypothetical protein
MTRYAVIVPLVLVAIHAFGAPARAQVGPGFDLSWNTIDTGAGFGAGGNFEMEAVIGQPDAGSMTGGPFEIRGGFFGVPAGAPPCYPDCNGDGVADIADFGCFTNKFIVGDPYADCNGDGVLDIADFGCFVNAFIVGCP